MPFEFKQKQAQERYAFNLHLPKSLHDRIIQACEKLGIEHGRGKGCGSVKNKKSQQELIRQMIDHCLKEMGI